MRSFAAASHTGHRRRKNEDCHGAEPDLGLWVLADGVGGNVSGEVAAALAVDTVLVRAAAGDGLATSIDRAHIAILREMRARGNADGMGTTVLALRVAGDDYEIAWVGDSRAYLFDGSLRRLTRDHGPVGEMLARGEITLEEAETHPDRNLLSQSLGVSDRMRPVADRVRGTLKPGQCLVLCSDGLTDEVPDREIAAVLAAHEGPRERTDALVRAALDAGGRDNVTVIVVGERSHPLPIDGQQPAGRARVDRGARGGVRLMAVGALLIIALGAASWLLL